MRPPRRDPNWNFKAVGAEVPKVTAKCMEKFGFHSAEILVRWRAIVGDNLAAYTSPFRIRWARQPDALDPDDESAPNAAAGAKTPVARMRAQKTSLEVIVADGRAHELPYRAPQIMQRINSYFGYRAITEIRPIAGEVKPRSAQAAKRQPAEPSPNTSSAVLKLTQKDIARVDDPALKSALERLADRVSRQPR